MNTNLLDVTWDKIKNNFDPEYRFRNGFIRPGIFDGPPPGVFMEPNRNGDVFQDTMYGRPITAELMHDMIRAREMQRMRAEEMRRRRDPWTNQILGEFYEPPRREEVQLRFVFHRHELDQYCRVMGPDMGRYVKERILHRAVREHIQMTHISSSYDPEGSITIRITGNRVDGDDWRDLEMRNASFLNDIHGLL